MIFRYGCWVHILSILSLPLLAISFYLLFKNKSKTVKKIVVFSLLALNLFQHLFKFIVWPHYYGQGFGLIETAYNFCALIIILAPIIFFTKLKSLKTFMFFIGTIAGAIAISVPYWFHDGHVDLTIPNNISEYVRFYTCHALLFLSSILSFLFKLEKVNWKDFYKNGLYVLLFLFLIAINNFVFNAISKGSIEAGFNAIKNDNYCFVNGPKEISGLNWLMDFLDAVTLPFLKTDDGNYIMILWYAIPVYILFTVLSFIVYTIIDIKNFKKIFKKEIKDA